MNIYDACNVKDLLAGYLLLALGKDSPERTAELLALEAAIRAHVIREASVGSVSINLDPTVGFPLVDAPIVTHCEKPCVWVKYDLIPKETS